MGPASVPVSAAAAPGIGAKIGAAVSAGAKALGLAGASGILKGTTSGLTSATDSRLGYMLGHKMGSYSPNVGSAAIQASARREQSASAARMNKDQFSHQSREAAIEREFQQNQSLQNQAHQERMERFRAATQIETARIYAAARNDPRAQQHQQEYEERQRRLQDPVWDRWNRDLGEYFFGKGKNRTWTDFMQEYHPFGILHRKLQEKGIFED